MIYGLGSDMIRQKNVGLLAVVWGPSTKVPGLNGLE